MITAIIRNKENTLVLELPHSIYDIYEKLQSIGIMQPPKQIPLTDNEDEDIGVKLFSESDFGQHLLLTLNEKNSIADANADYVKENPYIYLSVKGDDMVFQITACFITDIDFDYIAPNPTGEELTNFFEQVAKKNWLEFDGVTFGEEDTVLTLSTCCRKYDEYNTGNQRLVLMAKLLPEGAIAQDFTVRLAPEPEMP